MSYENTTNTWYSTELYAVAHQASNANNVNTDAFKKNSRNIANSKCIGSSFCEVVVRSKADSIPEYQPLLATNFISSKKSGVLEESVLLTPAVTTYIKLIGGCITSFQTMLQKIEEKQDNPVCMKLIVKIICCFSDTTLQDGHIKNLANEQKNLTDFYNLSAVIEEYCDRNSDLAILNTLWMKVTEAYINSPFKFLSQLQHDTFYRNVFASLSQMQEYKIPATKIYDIYCDSSPKFQYICSLMSKYGSNNDFFYKALNVFSHLNDEDIYQMAMTHIIVSDINTLSNLPIYLLNQCVAELNDQGGDILKKMETLAKYEDLAKAMRGSRTKQALREDAKKASEDNNDITSEEESDQPLIQYSETEYPDVNLAGEDCTDVL